MSSSQGPAITIPRPARRKCEPPYHTLVGPFEKQGRGLDCIIGRMESIPVFDGHNDTLLNLRLPDRGKGRSFFERSELGHVDLPRARRSIQLCSTS